MDTLVLGRKRRSNARSGHLLQSAWGTGGDILELGGSSDGKDSGCNAEDLGSIPAGVRRGKWQPTPVFLSGKSHGWRNLIGYSPWGRKQLNTTEQLHFHI